MTQTVNPVEVYCSDTGEDMIKLDSKRSKLELSFKDPQGKHLAEMLLQAVYLYGTQTDEDRAILRQMAKMVKGEEPAVTINLKDYAKASKEVKND